MKYPLVLVLLLALTCGFADAKTKAKSKRSDSAKSEVKPAVKDVVKDEFRRENPCPVNGSSKGPCKGYVVEHVYPLTCGGLDAPSNMQWQTVAGAQANGKWAQSACGRNKEQP